MSGNTQTIYPWDSPAGSREPAQGFHDIFDREAQPLDADEVRLIRRLTGRGRACVRFPPGDSSRG